MCLRHNLAQGAKDEDPPHAKIASDVMSRLFSVSYTLVGFKIINLVIIISSIYELNTMRMNSLMAMYIQGNFVETYVPAKQIEYVSKASS